jgi:hypothetical protein
MTKVDRAAPMPIAAIPPTDVHRQLASLRTATTPALKQQWRALFGNEPPAFNRAYLQSRLAYRVQELAFAALKSETVARLEALGEPVGGGNAVLRRIRADDQLLPGTRLVREHGGIEHVVTVLNAGFDFEGRPYRSLSAIARAITGTRWNGWTFFGLRGRGAA